MATGCSGPPATTDGGDAADPRDVVMSNDTSDSANDDAPPGDVADQDAVDADDANTVDAIVPTDASDASSDGGAPCGTPAECSAAWEQAAIARFTTVASTPADLTTFLRAMPKGGDLHNHLSGAVYAETYLTWGMRDGDCINPTTFAAGFPSTCSTGNQPTPSSGPFYDQIVRAWSMLDFMAGTETGHDHFFATFGKYGAIAGNHRDDSIADIATRAASENQVYVETMFNLGTNVGSLAASMWSGTVTPADLPSFYDMLLANPAFMTRLTSDVTAVTNAATRYRNGLNCAGANPPAACAVQMRFVAQVSRTGGNDQIFGQLVSAFEMAMQTQQIVGVNLSSPEDDTSSLRNYDLHMAMLDFLYNRYTATGRSPLHITLHAGELVPAYLPAGYATANTFHIRRAVEVGHAERIGHGLDILSETDSAGLMDEMRDRNVMVEVCLSSNDQILLVSGTNHPLSQYLMHNVPIAFATDDQGVSRSSMAGEMQRAVVDQHFDYLQLKRAARTSLEHAFLPGASLWTNLATAQPVAECAATATGVIGFDPPSTECQAFLSGSERARTQWELERRFRAFESQQ